MEFPNVGQHCAFQTCNKLDFLPLKCDSCNNIYCMEHFGYNMHECVEGLKKDVQVPVCPLCNKPVACRRGVQPDIAVGDHIDRDCESDPALSSRKTIFHHKCSFKGCKRKEMIRLECSQCKLNYCITHRHAEDHNCRFNSSDESEREANAGSSPVRPCVINDIMGSLDEDEAIACAIALSMEDQEGLKRSSDDDNVEEDEAVQIAIALSLVDIQRQDNRPLKIYNRSNDVPR